METLNAIYTRQSVKKVRPDPIPRELVEHLLNAAVQAPNHHKNRPWRFVVLSGPARERLGEVMADSLRERIPETHREALEKERARPLRAPLLIAVGIDKAEPPRTEEIENICAGAAAVQNLLLAAHDIGLGAIWRTGSAASDPRVKQFLGFEPNQHLIGIIYIGHLEGARELPQRPSFHDRTTWLEQ